MAGSRRPSWTRTPHADAVSMDSTAIWPADWSQFLPDLVNTAVVGALVGLGLWLVQSQAAKRERREFAERTWAHARPRIIGEARPLKRTMHLDFWKGDADRVIAAAVGVDVVALGDALPDNAEVSALALIQREYPHLDRLTSALESAIRYASDEWSPALNTPARRTVRQHYSAQLLNVSPPTPIYFGHGDVQPYACALERDVMPYASEYLTALEAFEHAYAVLSNSYQSATEAGQRS